MSTTSARLTACFEPFFDDGEIIRQNIFGLGLAARLDHPRCEGEAVDVAHLACAGRLARVDEFIARGQYRHPWAAVDLDRGDPHARKRADILTPQARARSQDQLAFFEIIAYAEDVLAHGGGTPGFQRPPGRERW